MGDPLGRPAFLKLVVPVVLFEIMKHLVLPKTMETIVMFSSPTSFVQIMSVFGSIQLNSTADFGTPMANSGYYHSLQSRS